jgi:DNA-binding NarL/FixJ family response regulator
MSGERLVIIDDQLLIASSLASILRLEGWEVETISGPSAPAVIDAVSRLAPVLVLLDLVLGPPLGSGLDLIRPLTVAGGRVVMMTGEAEPSRLGACVEAGAVGILSKTIGWHDLVDAVRRAGNNEQLLTQHQREILLAALQNARESDRRREAPFRSLSRREQAVLVRIMAGDSADAIAENAYVSITTIRGQIRAILKKLGVPSQLAAVAMAHEAHWPPAPAE